MANTIMPAGDLTGDSASEFVIRSPWGIGVMSVNADNQFRCRNLHPYGATLGSWPLESSDLVIGASPFMGSGRNELLVVKPWVGSATSPAFTATVFENWHHNVRRSVRSVRPNNLAELVNAVIAAPAFTRRSG